MADQLYYSKSKTIDGFEPKKIYFFQNLVVNLFAQRQKAIKKNKKLYNNIMYQETFGVIANREQFFEEKI